MINAALMDTLINRQEHRTEPRRPEPSSQFAKVLDVKSRGGDNRREETGRSAEDPIKGTGRREWAHQRSRVDMGSRNRHLEKKDLIEGNDNDQGQMELTETPMNAWFAELSTTLDQLVALMDEETLEIPLEMLKELESLIQTVDGHQPLMDQMKLVTEQLDQLTKTLDVMLDSIPKDQFDEDVKVLVEKLKQLMDGNTATTQTEQHETAPDMKEASWESMYQSATTSQEIEAKTIKSEQSHPANPNPEALDLTVTDFKDNPGSSDTQPDLKEFAATEKFQLETTENKSLEDVIPFSLHQIDSLLNQNPLIQELDQQKELLQQSVMQQVLDKIQVVHGSNQSFVTMHLIPEHLGKLTIQLATDLQQGMTARIYAETAHAKEMIESNFGQLKDALSGKGVNLTSMEVFVGQDSESSEKQREFHYQQALSQRRKVGKQASIAGIGTQLMTEQITATINPYMKSEGFDQLG